MTYEELKEHICDLGFEDAIVFENPDYAAAYEESIEFIDFNTIRALPYMGDRGPIVLYDDLEVVDVDAPSKDDDIDYVDNE